MDVDRLPGASGGGLPDGAAAGSDGGGGQGAGGAAGTGGSGGAAGTGGSGAAGQAGGGAGGTSAAIRDAAAPADPRPQALTLGSPCRVGADCASGFCADGVCCNQACDGPCRSCGLPGQLGRCQLVEAGTRHRGCADQGPTTCGTDGTCAADGTCARYPSGSVCGPDSCASGIEREAARCDGRGACVPGRSRACAPFVCAGTRCGDRCATDADCTEGTACQDGSCGKKALGVSCRSGTECDTGICAQGVCCEEACTGACRACNLTSAPGRCLPVPAGAPDPAKICVDEGRGRCGQDGACDGRGGCRLYPAGTICRAAECPAGAAAQQLAGTCDGRGLCVAGGSSSCAPYRCDGTSCRSRCSGDGDCVAPARCVAGSCGRRPLGDVCLTGADCASNHCVDGACCQVGACGTCQSCNVPGSAGRCTAVPSGKPDPHGRCGGNSAANPCGNIGLCDGGGGCLKAAAGVPCAPARCSGGTIREPSTCDGSGTCAPGGTRSCGSYQCDDGGGCRSSCTDDSHCANGATCRLKGRWKNTCRIGDD